VSLVQREKKKEAKRERRSLEEKKLRAWVYRFTKVWRRGRFAQRPLKEKQAPWSKDQNTKSWEIGFWWDWHQPIEWRPGGLKKEARKKLVRRFKTTAKVAERRNIKRPMDPGLGGGGTRGPFRGFKDISNPKSGHRLKSTEAWAPKKKNTPPPPQQSLQ